VRLTHTPPASGFAGSGGQGSTHQVDWGSQLGTQQQLFCSSETGCSRTVYRRDFPAKDKQASELSFQILSWISRALLTRKVPKHVLYYFGTGVSEPFEDEHEQ
jgi:hypothetical protein